MPNYGPDDVLVLIDGYDISGETYELGPIEREADYERNRGFGALWDTQAPIGTKRASVQHRSYYDDAALKTSAALVAQVGTLRAMGIWLEGNALGKNAVAFQLAQRNVARLPMRDELTKIAAEYLANGRLDECKVLQPFQAETATAGGTSPGGLDNAASSANGGRAYLFVNSLTLGGYTSLAINLQESSDNGGGDAYATKQVLVTGLTGGLPLASIVPITGAIERWTRINLAWAGAGAGQSVILAVLLVRD